MAIQIDTNLLAQITKLDKGGHEDFGHGMCAMEAVSHIAREPWSAYPECACPVIAAFMRSWNDSLPDGERTALLLPLVPKLVGTRGSKALEQRRATMAADWLIRVHTPAWLRLAKLSKQADLLASLPEITDFSQCPSLMPTLEAVRSDVAAARDAAWAAAARDAAAAAAWAAAAAAARDAARNAAWAAAAAAAGAAAAWAAAWATAARDAAWAAAAWAAAWATAARDAAWAAAARDAARDAFFQIKTELQQSAIALVERMIAARDDDHAEAA